MSSGTSYFDQVSSQLEVTVGKQMSGVVSGVSANAEAGVSPSINALDTGLKAATALGEHTSGNKRTHAASVCGHTIMPSRFYDRSSGLVYTASANSRGYWKCGLCQTCGNRTYRIDNGRGHVGCNRQNRRIYSSCCSFHTHT